MILLAACSRTTDTAAVTPPPRPVLDAFPAAWRERVDAAETALARTPEDASAWSRLGRLYHANSFLVEAQTCYEQAVAIDPADVGSTRYLADVAREQGDPAAEQRWLAETVRRQPAYVAARLQLAELHYKTGERSAALTAFQDVLQEYPNNGYATIALARDELAQGRSDAARRRLEAFVVDNAGWSSAYAVLAQIHAATGDIERAAALRQQARERKDPLPDDPWMDALHYDSFDLTRLAITFEERVKSGDGTGAGRILERMETVAPDHWMVRRFRAVALGRLGRHREAALDYEAALAAGGDLAVLYPAAVTAWRAAGELDRATQQLRAGLEATPRTVALWILAADMERQAGDLPQARSSLETALRLAPDNVAALRELASLHWQADRRADAGLLLEKIRRLAPDDVAARAMLGQLFYEAGQLDDAITVLTEAVALHTDSSRVMPLLAAVWLRRGNDHARAGRTTDAVADYDRAIAAWPTYAEAYTNKAKLFLRQGESRAALDAYRPLVDRDPRNPVVHLTWGDIQAAAGERPAAVQAWRQARSFLDSASDPALRSAIDSRLP